MHQTNLVTNNSQIDVLNETDMQVTNNIFNTTQNHHYESVADNKFTLPKGNERPNYSMLQTTMDKKNNHVMF